MVVKIVYSCRAGPSPDWVVGVSGLELCNRDCSWAETKTVDLFPYDAGTDNGISYMVTILRHLTFSYSFCSTLSFYLQHRFNKQWMNKHLALLLPAVGKF